MPDHDAQMLKGVLGLLLLHLLAAREDYGYALVVRLHEHGFTQLAEGTVYPALSRLESQGLLEAHLVRSASGPARKYYRTTAAGRAEMDRLGQMWHRLVGAVAAIAGPGEPMTGATATPSGELSGSSLSGSSLSGSSLSESSLSESSLSESSRGSSSRHPAMPSPEPPSAPSPGRPPATHERTPS